MKKPLHHHLYDYFFPHRRNNHRPNLFSLASIGALVVAVIVFEAGYLVQTKFVFFNTDFLASVLPGALITLTNQDRAASGLAGVTEDALLDRAAQAAAEDMAANGYFAHVSPDGKSPWYWLDQAGYKYTYAGENLAVNFTDSSNVETAWMNSPTHRSNIEKPQYTKVGIGTASGIYEGAETTFVVQFFATPAIAPVQEVVPAKIAIATPPTSSGVGTPTRSVGAAVEKPAPASIALVTPPVNEPVSTSTAPVTVLGSQTTDVTPAQPVPTTSASPIWLGFLFLLSSPLHMLSTIFTILFALIAIVLTIAILVRGRVRLQHPSVVMGGAFLLLLISGAMLFSSTLAGSVQLNAQAASVYMSLP